MSFFNSDQQSTILVTGGASGIGLALSKRLIKLGHIVIVAGRRQHQLDLAKSETPALFTIQGDVSNDAGRITLFQKVSKEFPDINVLVNNAGCVNPDAPSLYKDMTESLWEGHKNVIAVNLEGPIHLSTLFLKHFLVHGKPSMIVNVSTLAAFIPFARYATYAASKAALHSFTISLRHQLKDSNIKVVEIFPPAVDTDIAPPDVKAMAIDVETYASDTIRQLVEGDNVEIGFESELFPSGQILRGSRDFLDGLFEKFNA